MGLKNKHVHGKKDVARINERNARGRRLLWLVLGRSIFGLMTLIRGIALGFKTVRSRLPFLSAFASVKKPRVTNAAGSGFRSDWFGSRHRRTHCARLCCLHASPIMRGGGAPKLPLKRLLSLQCSIL